MRRYGRTKHQKISRAVRRLRSAGRRQVGRVDFDDHRVSEPQDLAGLGRRVLDVVRVVQPMEAERRGDVAATDGRRMGARITMTPMA